MNKPLTIALAGLIAFNALVLTVVAQQANEQAQTNLQIYQQMQQMDARLRNQINFVNQSATSQIRSLNATLTHPLHSCFEITLQDIGTLNNYDDGEHIVVVIYDYQIQSFAPLICQK